MLMADHIVSVFLLVLPSQEKGNAESVKLQSDLTEQKEKLSETNKELAMEVGSLRRLASEREQQLKQSQEEVSNAKAEYEVLAEQLAQLKVSLEETDKYRLYCDELAKQLTELRAGDEVSKTEIDSMISEKISLALELEKARTQSSTLSSKLANSEAEASSIRDSYKESLNELDDLRAALLDTQSQLQTLKSHHEQVMADKESLESEVVHYKSMAATTEAATQMSLEQTIDDPTQMSLEQTVDVTDIGLQRTGDADSLQQMAIVDTSHIEGRLQQTIEELELTIADRDELIKEISSLRDQLEGMARLSQLVEDLREEKAVLELKLAESHDAQLVDERLAKLQDDLEVGK